MEVLVVPPDPAWREQFQQEARLLNEVLPELVVRVHHIGSTAIPGIYAKPIIDILLEVRDLEGLDSATHMLERVRYEAMGEYGLPGRRYFRKSARGGRRSHHLHAFMAGDAEVARHLAFRDYLRAHPDAAREYSDLKRRLSATHSRDREAYMDGKEPFIARYEREALLWASGRRDLP